MNFLYTLFIALANNIDNIGVRIAYSIRGIKISVTKNIWISIITFIFSSASAFSGTFLSKYFSKNVTSIISMILLILIGLWMIIEPYIRKNNQKDDDSKKEDKRESGLYDILKKPENADIDDSKDIDFKEATLLGIALSINNIGGGLSAGMIELNIFFMGFFSAAISFAALWSGNYLTKFMAKLNIGNYATAFAGVLLILMGLKQII